MEIPDVRNPPVISSGNVGMQRRLELKILLQPLQELLRDTLTEVVIQVAQISICLDEKLYIKVNVRIFLCCVYFSRKPCCGNIITEAWLVCVGDMMEYHGCDNFRMVIWTQKVDKNGSSDRLLTSIIEFTINAWIHEQLYDDSALRNTRINRIQFYTQPSKEYWEYHYITL
ncbi:hypothetical protein YC2023_007384 [Brassica napus]